MMNNSNVVDTRTALEILQRNAHLKVKYILGKNTEIVCAFADVLAGGETVFSLSEWHDRINPILASEATVGEWLASHQLTVRRWKEECHATDVKPMFGTIR